jgi:5-carboxymethyl-2-hydroxymuconate isomerase
MPHFILDCSADILIQKNPGEIMRAVYETAEATNLFAKNDIKVRIRPFEYFLLGDDKNDFIHVFGNIMEGRTTEQKAQLSRSIIERLNTMFPDVSILSINIRDFEKSTYCNKALLNPENILQNRHFPK